MRFTTSRLIALLPFVTAILANASPDGSAQLVDSNAQDSLKRPSTAGTTFNSQHVPPMQSIPGASLNSTVKDGYWLVEFFHPTCVHCIAFAPVYQTLYEFYYTSDPLGKTSQESAEALNSFSRYYDFNFAKVDCLVNADACGEQGIMSYPTLVLFKRGEFVKKSSGGKDLKTASDFVEDILEAIKPGSRPNKGLKLPEVGAHTVDTSAEPDEPAAKHKDPVAGAAAGEVHNEKMAAATSAEAARKTEAAKDLTSKAVNVDGKSIGLNAAAFQQSVMFTKDAWFVKFYAPWCHHCQALAPKWEEMAREMKGKLNIGEVNCDIERTLCTQFQVDSYPTMLLFQGGEFITYRGLRGVGDLIRYANQAMSSGGGAQEVDFAQYAQLEKNEEVIFTYFYDHATTAEDFTALDRLTMSLIGKGRLVKTADKQIIERFKITSFPRLMVSRDGQPTYYSALAPNQMRDPAKVISWMQTVWLPLVPELTSQDASEITRGRLTVLAILSRDRADEFRRAKEEMKAAAKDWTAEAQTSFQLERQKARDAKQAKIDHANAVRDRKAWEKAKDIKIEEEKLKQGKKDVQFAWVDGVAWERWCKTTYGVQVSKDGGRVIILDQDRNIFYPSTRESKDILPDRHAILDTLRDAVNTPSILPVQSTHWWLGGIFFTMTHFWSNHPTAFFVLLTVTLAAVILRRRSRKSAWHGGMGGLNGSAGEVEKGFGSFLGSGRPGPGKVD